jgi:hypothetical protein
MKLVPMQKVSVVVEAGTHERLLEALKTAQGVAYCAVQSVASPEISSDTCRVRGTRLLLELLVDSQRARELLLRLNDFAKEFGEPHVMVTEVQCMSVGDGGSVGASSSVPREVRWGDYIITM